MNQRLTNVTRSKNCGRGGKRTRNKKEKEKKETYPKGGGEGEIHTGK
jgi:hypothetical protein